MQSIVSFSGGPGRPHLSVRLTERSFHLEAAHLGVELHLLKTTDAMHVFSIAGGNAASLAAECDSGGFMVVDGERVHVAFYERPLLLVDYFEQPLVRCVQLPFAGRWH